MNEKIITKTDSVLSRVGEISDLLSDRTQKINFKKDVLDENDINDLKLHLGYTRNYADLARLRLHYFKEINSVSSENDE